MIYTRVVITPVAAVAFAFAVEAAPCPAQPPLETPAFPADPPASWLTYHLAHPGTTAPAAPPASADGITELIEATTTPRVCGFLYCRLPPPLPR